MAKIDEAFGGWLTRPQTQKLLQILNGKGAITRCVGGCVRDTLLQVAHAATEVDMATDLKPEAAMERLKAEDIKVVPTGIKHGTVSAILYDGKTPLVYEITTLRVDVETDGRHAEVAFTQDWQGDAARRDFTINALYADADGTLHDPTGLGFDDISQKHVRFIGDAAARIEEDYLRVLRYFRFHYRLTPEAQMDEAARQACAATGVPLRGLSGERKQAEMIKIMALPAAAKAMRAMHEAGLLRPVLGVEPMDFTTLEALMPLSDDPLLRLMTLLPSADAAQTMATVLRLSKKQTLRLVTAFGRPLDTAHLAAALYFDGAQAVSDRALLALASGQDDARLKEAVQLAADYKKPKFPLTGAMMQKAGLANGPDMGAMSNAIEQWWVEEGFPDSAAVEAELKKRL